MDRKKSGLSRKMTVLCLMLAVVICAGACTVGYFTYRNSIYEAYSSFAYSLAYTASSYVDGDRITGYLDTGTPDGEYDEMARQLNTIYRSTELSSIYISKPKPETMTLLNIYDVRIHEAADPAPYAIGVEDPITGDPEEVVRIYETGELSDSYFIRKSRFGYNTSAILPVQNSGGETVAILVADMPMPNIIRDLNRYLALTVAVTVLLGLLVLGVTLSYLRRKMIAPIRLLTANAEGFASSRTGFSEEVLSIRTGDEVETLARALAKMERDITQYIENLAAVTAEKERIGAELSIATQIQADMLPSLFPAFPERQEFDIYATMTPAKEVGGDFYDFFMVDDRHLAIVMADVSGKGVPAALFMVIGKTLIKDHTLPGADLGEVFTQVNELLCEANKEGLFITAFEGVLDLVTGELRFVNAGHEPPFLCPAGGSYTPYKTRPGFVLAGMEGMVYRADSVTLSPGDKLFQYTDGVTEATRADQELYGMERLQAVLDRSREAAPHQLLPAVKADIDAFVGEAEQFDDITMLCVEFKCCMKEERGGQTHE